MAETRAAKKIITEKTKKKNRRTWTTSSVSQPTREKKIKIPEHSTKRTNHPFFLFLLFFAVLFLLFHHPFSTFFFLIQQKKISFCWCFSLCVCFVQKDIRKVFFFSFCCFPSSPHTLHISNVFQMTLDFTLKTIIISATHKHIMTAHIFIKVDEKNQIEAEWYSECISFLQVFCFFFGNQNQSSKIKVFFSFSKRWSSSTTTTTMAKQNNDVF